MQWWTAAGRVSHLPPGGFNLSTCRRAGAAKIGKLADMAIDRGEMLILTLALAMCVIALVAMLWMLLY